MKGILLSGGHGTRLYPLTKMLSKQLLPVYDKPMVYYPLSTLMLAGVREILLISTKEALPLYKKLLGDGSHLGIQISYMVQNKPKGIAESFLLAEDFIDGDNVALALGDNLFYGGGLGEVLKSLVDAHTGARLFSYYVKNPEAYGVIRSDEKGKILEIMEKPKVCPSNYAVTGLYFYDNKVVSFAKSLKPSQRGELEITDINNLYLEINELKVTRLSRGTAWLDTGTPSALLQASNFISTLEERQGLKIACLEEIALKMGYISLSQFRELAESSSNSSYREYLLGLMEGEDYLNLSRVDKAESSFEDFSIS